MPFFACFRACLGGIQHRRRFGADQAVPHQAVGQLEFHHRGLCGAAELSVDLVRIVSQVGQACLERLDFLAP